MNQHIKVLIAFRHPAVDCPTACHQGLGITAQNLALSLRECRIDADALPVSNGEFLWARLAGEWRDYSHVVLSAPFVHALFLGNLFRHFAATHFALIYHSNLAFLAQDAFAGKSLPRYISLQKECPNFRVGSNSRELYDAVRRMGPSDSGCELFEHLPNLYHLPHRTRRTRDRWKPGQTLQLGLFGASRVLKNWLTAGAAAMILSETLGVKVKLNISTGRDEGGGATREVLESLIAMNPMVDLVHVPWLGHDDFCRYLYGMDLLLQPSFSETFNNVTADGCACGVPSVVSEAIDWAPEEWIAKADSAVSVANVAIRLLRDRHAVDKGWKALDAYNRQSITPWMEWLNAGH